MCPLFSISDREKIEGVASYVAQREETVGFWPLGYATVSGLRIMLPPQASPTHPRAFGAIT